MKKILLILLLSLSLTTFAGPAKKLIIVKSFTLVETIVIENFIRTYISKGYYVDKLELVPSASWSSKVNAVLIMKNY